MEFNEKLQHLRKQKGFTQEELAELLFVSRTAISKWESGRGYPNIDSLKAIARLFSVSIDNLLSNAELLTLAEEETKQKENHLRNLVFGLLDLASFIFFFLPLFGQRIDGIVYEVTLLSLTEIPLYLKISYFTVLTSIIICGILTLTLKNCNLSFWVQSKFRISLVLNIIAIAIFILSLQSYVSIFMFVFLIIKVLMLIKKY